MACGEWHLRRDARSPPRAGREDAAAQSISRYTHRRNRHQEWADLGQRRSQSPARYDRIWRLRYRDSALRLGKDARQRPRIAGRLVTSRPKYSAAATTATTGVVRVPWLFPPVSRG